MLSAMRPKVGAVYLRYLPDGEAAGSAAKCWDEGQFIAPGPSMPSSGETSTRSIAASAKSSRPSQASWPPASFSPALSGLWLSGRYLRRIDAISGTCRAIMARELKERVLTRGAGGELERLAATVNSMLDRIQVLMESLRQVSDDIAHDLRTPLAHLRYSLE